jgi:hypothetical protein
MDTFWEKVGEALRLLQDMFSVFMAYASWLVAPHFFVDVEDA